MISMVHCRISSELYACAFGGIHPSNIRVTLADRPVQLVTRVKYLVCTMICRSSEIDVSPLVGKFYGSFNNILRVLGTGKIEMVSLQLNKSYCLPHLVYCCDAWHIRTSQCLSLIHISEPTRPY